MHHDGAMRGLLQREGCLFCLGSWQHLQVFLWIGWLEEGKKETKIRSCYKSQHRGRERHDQRRPSKTKTAKKVEMGKREGKTWMQAGQSGGARAAWRGLLLNKRRSPAADHTKRAKDEKTAD